MFQPINQIWRVISFRIESKSEELYSAAYKYKAYKYWNGSRSYIYEIGNQIQNLFSLLPFTHPVNHNKNGKWNIIGCTFFFLFPEKKITTTLGFNILVFPWDGCINMKLDEKNNLFDVLFLWYCVSGFSIPYKIYASLTLLFYRLCEWEKCSRPYALSLHVKENHW